MSILSNMDPLSAVAHVIFGSFRGYALGRRAEADSRGVIVIAGIAASALVRGMFNLFLFAFPLVSIGLVALGVWRTLRRFNWARTVFLSNPFVASLPNHESAPLN